MFKKISFFIIVLGIVLLINGCTNQTVNESSNIQKEEIESEFLIGGQRDEHGCLSPAGYSWNNNLGACIREWELKDNQRKAVQIVSDILEYEFTVVEVVVGKCPGCFILKLQENDNREMFEIRLEDGKITE